LEGWGLVLRLSQGLNMRASRLAVLSAMLLCLVLLLVACGGSTTTTTAGPGTTAGPATTAAPTTTATSSTTSSSGTTNAAKKIIAVSFPHADQPMVQAMFDGAKAEATKRGYTLTIDDPGDDLNKQMGTINTWIDAKSVGAIVSGILNSPDVFNQAAAKSVAAGIPWISYAATISNESAFVSWDHQKGGYMIGEEAANWINSALGGKAKVAIIGFEQGEWARLRRQGMEEALKKVAPGAVIVSQQDALDAATAASKVETILQANPDLNVVLCIMDTTGEGAYQAFLNTGHKADDPKVFIGGMDGSQRAEQLILEGGIYRGSAALKLNDIGKAVIDTPADILEGGAPKDTLVPYALLTLRDKALVQEYLAEWK
jgi:ribose transport system substrate-binding protein